MRLINVLTLKLEEFFGRPPPYAILSHTWGPEEVTFERVQSKIGTQKSGWQKIQRACKQAHDDGFLYVWCDTCCINKSSSAELSESINSMFRWYQEAAVCYTYLEDTQDVERLASSRWFTRGWTLQELIAPRHLKFYDSQWRAIGTREDLASEISVITMIDWEALHGTKSVAYVRGASLAKKMAWAANRITTREEDIAYCLIGLFDVNMPLLYGEGSIKAFARLQEEVIKRGLDQSFLAWLIPTDRRSSIHSDLEFFADHPKCFRGCEDVLTTGDDVSPFSLNNRGLQIRLPVFQENVKGRSTRYIAILACYSESSNTERIGIVLNAVERTGNHFVHKAASSHRVVSAAEFQTARLQDCCILRTSAHANRQMLWVRNPVRTPVRNPALGFWLWKPETLYLDTSGSIAEWRRHKSRREFIELPDPAETGSCGTTYGFVVTPPQRNNPIPTIVIDDEKEVWKVLVRVDLGVEVRYTAKVSIHCLCEPKGLDDKDLSYIPRMRATDIPQSRFQTMPLRSKQPMKLAASIAWNRISNQDILILDIAINASETTARWRGMLALLMSWPVISWNYYMYSFFAALLMRSLYPTMSPWVATVILLVSRLPYSPALLQPEAPGLWSIFQYMSYFLALATLFRNSASVYSLLLPPRVLGKPEIRLRLAVVLLSFLVDSYLANVDPIAQWLFAITVTIGLEALVTIREHYFSPYKDLEASWSVRNRVYHEPY
jgi:hypothetical protein